MTTPSPAPPAEPESGPSERLARFLLAHSDQPGDQTVRVSGCGLTAAGLTLADLHALADRLIAVRALLIEVNADPCAEDLELHLIDQVADALGIARCEVCGTLEGVHTEDECYQ